MRIPNLPAPSVAQQTEDRWIYPVQHTVCQKNHQENDHSNTKDMNTNFKISGTNPNIVNFS